MRQSWLTLILSFVICAVTLWCTAANPQQTPPDTTARLTTPDKRLDLLPLGRFAVDVLRFEPSPRLAALNRKLMNGVKRRPLLFLEQIDKAQLGVPLPYNPRFGLTRREYAEYLALIPTHVTLKKVGESELIVQAEGDVLTLQGPEGTPLLTGFRIDTRHQTVTTPDVTLTHPEAAVASKPQGWMPIRNGWEWQYLPETLPDGKTLCDISFSLGRQVSNGDGLLYYRLVKLTAHGVTTSKELILRYKFPRRSPPTLEDFKEAPAFEAERALAKQAGMLLSMREVQTPLPAPEQNAAPLYRQLTQQLQAHPLNANEAILEKLYARKPLSRKEIQMAALAWKRRPELFALIHRAANRPLCVFQRNWLIANPLEILFPEYAKMRMSVRMLTAESLVMAQRGKFREAVQNQALGFAVAQHAGSENILIANLVGVAMDRITLSGMEKILALAGENAQVAQAVQSAIVRHLHARSLAQALRRENAFYMGLIEMLRKTGPNGLKADPHLPVRQDRATWNAFLDTNAVSLLRQVRQLIAVADKPFPQAWPIVTAIDNAPELPAHYLGNLLLPSLATAIAARARLEARAAMDQAACALILWKAKHGTYPNELDEALMPIPADPFDGRSMRYRRTGAGFVLYVVGKAGTFDGSTNAVKPDAASLFLRYPFPVSR